MFERFTDRARRILVLAQEEACQLNHTLIGTEHVLLAFIREGEGVAAKALAPFGLTLEATRSVAEQIVGKGSYPPRGHVPYTRRLKNILELSSRESYKLGHNYIGTEHLLMALMRDSAFDGGVGVAARILRELDIDLIQVRRQCFLLLRLEDPAPITNVRSAPDPLPPLENKTGSRAEVEEEFRQVREVLVPAALAEAERLIELRDALAVRLGDTQLK